MIAFRKLYPVVAVLVMLLGSGLVATAANLPPPVAAQVPTLHSGEQTTDDVLANELFAIENTWNLVDGNFTATRIAQGENAAELGTAPELKSTAGGRFAGAASMTNAQALPVPTSAVLAQALWRAATALTVLRL